MDWTPDRPTAPGWYWLNTKNGDCAWLEPGRRNEVVEIAKDGTLWRAGCDYEAPPLPSDYPFWYGPLTPPDFVLYAHPGTGKTTPS